MRTTWLLLICLLMGGALAQENAIQNPDFSQAAPGDASAPAHWRLPEQGMWRRAPAGPGGQICLHYEAPTALCGPVSQRVQYLDPAVTWELRARLQAAGGLVPVLVVRDAGDGRELARATADASTLWQVVGLRFKPVSADVDVQIYADNNHYKGAQAGAGSVSVAQVELVQLVGAAGAQQIPDLGENIALGATYTMTRPSYALCTDPDDKLQLTDGVYSQGYFWTQKTTVGWTQSGPKFVRIDLGQVFPIRGLSFSTAAGVAGVTWPKRILVTVSDDGERWYEVGDLVALATAREPLPPYGTYQVLRIWTDQLHTYGRYIGLGIEPSGPYTFCDEIEVYRGDDAWLAEARPAQSVPGPEEYLANMIVTGLIQEQLRRDLAAVREDLQTLDGARELAQRADALERDIAALRPVSMEGFRAVLPMIDLERDIFRLQARVWAAQGKPPLRVWHQHRWDPLAPSAEPTSDQPPALSIHMMSNECRADVLDLTNATAEVMELKVNISGLPQAALDSLSVHQVEHVGTRHFTSVAAALPEAMWAGDGWQVQVPAGMTRQVWLSFNRPELPAGEYRGQVLISGAGQSVQVPLALHVYPLRYPDRNTLLVGGWEYTNANAYGVTPENRQALIAHLIDHGVNAPWATAAALPQGKYDAHGNMIEEPSTENFDAWQADWPNAQMYMVFLGINDKTTFGGAERGTERFRTALGNWARFWAAHLQKLGIEPSRLGILTLDEPRNQEHYNAVVDWARAIAAAGTGIKSFTDPIASEPEGLEAMYEVVDIICPNRALILTRPEWYLRQVREAQAKGKQMWLYSCSGPARSFDPYSYYLAQAWDAFRLGAKASCFWCFTDTGGVSCWNEYPAGGAGPYCPSYIDDTSVTTSKYIEAIREGAQDYEYMTMLATRVAELENRVPAARLAKARELLATGPDRVLAGEKGTNWRWDEVKDRAAQDQVRIEVLETLTDLARL